MPGHDFIFEECAKLCGGKGIEAARRFIEEQDFGLMKDGAQKAEALNGAGGKQPYLAIECFDEMEAFGERMNAAVEARIGNVIELAKEAQILGECEVVWFFQLRSRRGGRPPGLLQLQMRRRAAREKWERRKAARTRASRCAPEETIFRERRR